VLHKLGVNLKSQEINDIVNLKAFVIERLLLRIKERIMKYGKQLENNPMENVSNVSVILQNQKSIDVSENKIVTFNKSVHRC
jgi:hypothetical protein